MADKKLQKLKYFSSLLDRIKKTIFFPSSETLLIDTAFLKKLMKFLLTSSLWELILMFWNSPFL